MVDPGSSLNLAAAAVSTAGEFESAMETVAPFLTATEQYSFVVARLVKTDHPESNSASVLRLLHLIVDVNCRWPEETLRAILNRIREARPETATYSEYRRQDEFLQQISL